MHFISLSGSYYIIRLDYCFYCIRRVYVNTLLSGITLSENGCIIRLNEPNKESVPNPVTSCD